MDEATAFAPGHVTAFFSTHQDPDPTKAGSRGGGVTLSDGVHVTVSRDGTRDPGLQLDGEPVVMNSVTRVLESLRVTDAHINATTTLPLGAGFGVSGATALGTALAAGQVYERSLSENELVTIAHGAEVQAGTGLGDVVAQARGGMPLRLQPGAPPYGRLDGIAAGPRQVEYLVLGQLSTEEILSGDTDELSAAGERAISVVGGEPTVSRFMQSARRFAREAGLLTDEVRAVITDVSAADGDATMAMLGETVFALGTGLSDAGYDPASCMVDQAGAILE
jgi:pantoate kinase